jgi:hypothetical protein
MPSDPDRASSRYRAWLHDWAGQSGIDRENVKYISGRRNADHYNKFTFSVNCDGDLRQLVRLLHTFYSNDYLHRIKHLSVRPLKDKTLSMAFTIEVLSLPGAAADKELGPLPSDRLAFDDVDAYLNVIVNRNPYAPANQPPRFVSDGSTRGYLNQPMTIRPKAEDPEEQGVRFRLGESRLPGLEIDERSGTINWTPDRKGEFEIPVFAVDEGLPPKETATTIRIEVTDPPPPREPEPEPPAFDTAQFAYVTAFVEVNGRPEVWISSRTDGKLLRLQEGETFQIGLFEGQIEQISPRSVEIRNGDKTVSVRYGQSLTDGEVISQAEPAQDRTSSGG